MASQAAGPSSTQEKCTICGQIVDDVEKHIKDEPMAHPKWAVTMKKTIDRSIYIRDPPKKLTENKIKEYFSKLAPVKEVISKSTGVFVEFDNNESCDKVLKTQTHTVAGHKIKIVKRSMPPVTYRISANIAKANALAEKKMAQNRFVQTLESLREITQVKFQMLHLMSELQQSEDDRYARSEFRQELEQILQECIPGLNLVPFGSTHTGLGFIHSDMDLMINYQPMWDMPRGKRPLLPNQCFKLLQPFGGFATSSTMMAMKPGDQVTFYTTLLRDKCAHIIDSVLPIPNARVPIIKCHHKFLSFDIDISIGTNQLAIHNTRLIELLLALDSRVRPLVFTLKVWAHQMRVCGEYTKGLSSYALFMLIYTFLQNTEPPVLPSVEDLSKLCDVRHRSSVDCWDVSFCTDIDLIKRTLLPEQNDQSLPRLLRGFFYFYSSINLLRTVVCPRSGTLRPVLEFKKRFKDHQLQSFRGKDLAIQDPFELDRNIVQGLNHAGICSVTNAFILSSTEIETHYTSSSLTTLIPLLRIKPYSKNHSYILPYQESRLQEWLVDGQTPDTIVDHWYEQILLKVQEILEIMGTTCKVQRNFIDGKHEVTDEIKYKKEDYYHAEEYVNMLHSVSGNAITPVNDMDSAEAINVVFEKKTYDSATRPLLYRLWKDVQEVTEIWGETDLDLWSNRRAVRASIPNVFQNILEKELMTSLLLLTQSRQLSTPQRFHIRMERYTYGHELYCDVDVRGVVGSPKSNIVPFLRSYLERVLKSFIYEKP